MSIGNRRFPEIQNLASEARIHSIIQELNTMMKLLELSQHEGWEVLSGILTQMELDAMKALASGSTAVEDIAFNRAKAQICRYFREMPERLEQQREVLQSELDSVAPQGGTGNGRR